MVFHRIHDAVGDMILEDHAAGSGEGRLDRSQLDQDLGTVSTIRFTDSRWPIARDRRFTTCFVWVWLWLWAWLWECP